MMDWNGCIQENCNGLGRNILSTWLWKCQRKYGIITISDGHDGQENKTAEGQANELSKFNRSNEDIDIAAYKENNYVYDDDGTSSADLWKKNVYGYKPVAGGVDYVFSMKCKYRANAGRAMETCRLIQAEFSKNNWPSCWSSINKEMNRSLLKWWCRWGRWINVWKYCEYSRQSGTIGRDWLIKN